MNKVLALFLLCFVISVKAAPSIGVTKFLFASDSKFQNQPKPETPMESGTMVKVMQFNKNILDAIQVELVKFPLQLQQKLFESGDFASYNAESTIAMWTLANPNILKSLESATVVVPMEDASAESMVRTQVTRHYILLGWVYSITSEAIRNDIDSTDKKSILYNLDAKVKYKIVDSETKQVIAEFEGRGHGGYATIVPKTANVNNYNTQTSVNNTISSLLENIKHGLQVKQSQGLLGK